METGARCRLVGGLAGTQTLHAGASQLPEASPGSEGCLCGGVRVLGFLDDHNGTKDQDPNVSLPRWPQSCWKDNWG